MQWEYPFPVTYPLQSSEVLYSELYTKYCRISTLTCSNSNQLRHKENNQYRNVTRVWVSSNTLQYISLNTAAGCFKALMTITTAGDFTISYWANWSEMQVIIHSVAPLYLQGYVQAHSKHPMQNCVQWLCLCINCVSNILLEKWTFRLISCKDLTDIGEALRHDPFLRVTSG